MPDSQKFYLTTPIYYVNARPHIGHAYTTLAADVIARRHRQLGDDTFFLTGTDEHGQKIERSAAAAGIAPQQFADEVSASFENLWKRMGITNDRFIRTTSPEHKQGAQRLFADLHARGQIYLSSYTGQYSVGEEMFVEGPPGTIGPDGRPTETVTEENFFFKLSEYQEKLLNLIESNELSIQPEARRNEVLSFLRGNPTALVLEDEDPFDVAPLSPSGISEQKINRLLTEGVLKKSSKDILYVPGALRDLSVSRSSFTWGIPVPEPAASETKQKHVIYVWLDALANYMTALGYGSDTPEDIARFERYWPADLHLVGKEIIRFHCVYWPAFLLALRPDNVPEAEWIKEMIPKAVTAHGWLLFDDSKMSKSKGNIVRSETILDAFGTLCPPQPSLKLAEVSPDSKGSDQATDISPDAKGTGFSPSVTEAEGNAALAAEAISATAPTKAEQDLFATDVLRYFLLREIPFGSDGSFNFDAMITRYNADLANGYGNLVSRTLRLLNQNFPGGIEVPAKPWLCEDKDFWWGDNAPAKDEIFTGTNYIMKTIESEWSETFWTKNAFQVLLAEIGLRIGHIDGYLSFHKPWTLAKVSIDESRRKLVEVLYTAAESIRIITALLYPILPNATAKVWSQLGLGDIEVAAKNGDLKDLQWGGLKAGTKLGPLAPIFPRADKGLAQIMIDIEANQATPAKPTEEAAPITPKTQPTTQPAAEPAAAATPETPQITIDDFVKTDLRVAQILVAERIPKADKLLRLEVDLGYEKRQILSGIAQWYTPEELIGRRIVVIANLAPRKMRGLESHGMLLAASEGEDGKPVLATFGEDIALGSRLK